MIHGQKLLEVARNANSCSKRQELLKRCLAQSGQAYSAVTSFRYFFNTKSRVVSFSTILLHAKAVASARRARS